MYGFAPLVFISTSLLELKLLQKCYTTGGYDAEFRDDLLIGV